MIVISSALVLAATSPLNTPIFGYRNLATTANLSATTEDADHPASNLANPATHLYWLGETGSPTSDEYLTLDIQSEDHVDYVAVAGHNWGTAQITVSIEGATEMAGSPLDWTELVQETILPNDGPAVFRFEPQALLAVRIRLQPGSEAPMAAVVYTGKLLVAERGTHTDVTPINFGRAAKIINGRSESGNFLGRIVINESVATSFSLQRLRAAWYRTEMDPFIIASKDTPFFFAWKPTEFPNDVGYCWMSNDPQPAFHFDTGTAAIEMQLGGVAL